MLSDVIVPRSKPETPTPSPPTLGPMLGLVVIHMALGPILLQNERLATLHAVATVVVALGIAAVSPWVEHIVYAAAYVTGAEILWRVTDAQVFHEVGKYTVLAVLGLGLLRGVGRRRTALPLAYFVVLLPAVALTVQAVGLAAAREEVSFNLSGPACLAVAVLFFSRFETGWAVIKRILWALLIPLTSIAMIAAYSTVTATDLDFALGSNFVTSGGFGPNQVSAVLGLGALVGLVLAVKETRLSARFVALGLALWMLIQSVLTFSRGGVVNVAVAILLASLYSLKEPRRALVMVVPTLVIVLFAGFFVYPRLVSFTGGVLEKRFSDVTLGERGALLDADLRAWRENPVFGVGPGVGKTYRAIGVQEGASAHTEFTRLLAEHGMAGVIALGLILAMIIRAYRAARDPAGRAWVLLLASWALSEMAHGAMRMAAISFVFGLMACAVKEAERLSSPGEGAPALRPGWGPGAQPPAITS